MTGCAACAAYAACVCASEFRVAARVWALLFTLVSCCESLALGRDWWSRLASEADGVCTCLSCWCRVLELENLLDEVGVLDLPVRVDLDLSQHLVDIHHIDRLAERREDDANVVLRDQAVLVLVEHTEGLDQVLLGAAIGTRGVG